KPLLCHSPRSSTLLAALQTTSERVPCLASADARARLRRRGRVNGSVHRSRSIPWRRLHRRALSSLASGSNRGLVPKRREHLKVHPGPATVGLLGAQHVFVLRAEAAHNLPRHLAKWRGQKQ